MGVIGSNRKLLDFVHCAGKLDIKAAIITNPVKIKISREDSGDVLVKILQLRMNYIFSDRKLGERRT
ncbi:MAG: hypothetical protein A2Y97_05760 [Nitrospirae bacterium RBG_13_39_12]|nr:MAG: hypothetical protein A2Y97_05760 [Nitrospirae bacterium RBG_13_39_12]